MPNNDRRKMIRVDFNAQIILEADSVKVQTEGSSKDLSLSGVFVNTRERFPNDTPCKVRVLLSGMTDPLVLQMDGRVVRNESKGIAVVFESMDLDSYTHLKNVVRYNVKHPDEV